MDGILYNKIGNNYNKTRASDPYIAETIYQLIIDNKEGNYLDIGCGTGNYTIAIADKGVNVYGVDPSEKMLKIASERNDKINWLLGSAENIPLPDNFFNGIFGTLTLHHWQNIPAAFKELFRVMKEGGNLVFFTSTPEQMNKYWLNHYFPKMMQDSIKVMPGETMLQKAALEAGFSLVDAIPYSVQDNLKDCFLYVGKNNPEIYFDPAIRKGISSFAALSNIEEVNQGLEQLQKDIYSGEFKKIKEQFESNAGDYLFFRSVKLNRNS